MSMFIKACSSLLQLRCKVRKKEKTERLHVVCVCVLDRCAEQANQEGDGAGKQGHEPTRMNKKGQKDTQARNTTQGERAKRGGGSPKPKHANNNKPQRREGAAEVGGGTKAKEKRPDAKEKKLNLLRVNTSEEKRSKKKSVDVRSWRTQRGRERDRHREGRA